MSFDEQAYEQKYKTDRNEAKRYLQACIDEVREEAKNASSTGSNSVRRSSEFDLAKYSDMWSRSPMLASDYLNRYIDLVRRKAAVVEAKVNLEDSMTATTGFTIPAAQVKAPTSDAETTPVQKTDDISHTQSGWQKFKKSLFGK